MQDLVKEASALRARDEAFATAAGGRDVESIVEFWSTDAVLDGQWRCSADIWNDEPQS